MTRLLTLFAALALCQGLPAQTLTMPAEAKGKPGRLITIKAAGDCAAVQFFTPNADKIDVLAGFGGDPFTCLVVGEPGQYHLFAVGCRDNKLSPVADCLITIGTPPPPIPPPPADPLAAEIAAVYAADPSPQKAATKAALSAYYRAAVTACQSPAFTTTGGLNAQLRAAITLPADVLQPIRQIAGRELVKVLGTTDVPLTPEVRIATANTFAKLAAILEAL